MNIAPLVDLPPAVRSRVELLGAVEHYLAISRSAELFASPDYYDEAETKAWERMIDAVAMTDALGLQTSDEVSGGAG